MCFSKLPTPVSAVPCSSHCLPVLYEVSVSAPPFSCFTQSPVCGSLRSSHSRLHRWVFYPGFHLPALSKCLPTICLFLQSVLSHGVARATGHLTIVAYVATADGGTERRDVTRVVRYLPEKVFQNPLVCT